MARKDPLLDATEEMLIEAWQLQRFQRDPERVWLASGSRSCLPQPIRDKITDYGDPDAVPRSVMSPREEVLVVRVFERKHCLTLAVDARDRRMFGKVVGFKAGRQAGGFAWEDVWAAMGGKRSGYTGITQMRARYEGGLKRVAARAAALGVVVVERGPGMFNPNSRGMIVRT